MVAYLRCHLCKNFKLSVTKALMGVDSRKRMHFCVNEFEVDVNDSIFSGNEQQKV